jgi:hypothetical protein
VSGAWKYELENMTGMFNGTDKHFSWVLVPRKWTSPEGKTLSLKEKAEFLCCRAPLAVVPM